MLGGLSIPGSELRRAVPALSWGHLKQKEGWGLRDAAGKLLDLGGQG